MDGDDPWNWDIDRVVRELCSEDRTWPPRSDRQRLPNPVTLEKALRDNDIDGSTLLTDVDVNVLKDDLGVKNINERATIKHAITEFQFRSQKYEEWFRRRSSLASQYGEIALDHHRAVSSTFILPDRAASAFPGGFDGNRRLSTNLPTPPSPHTNDHLRGDLDNISTGGSVDEREVKRAKNDHIDDGEITAFLDHDDMSMPLDAAHSSQSHPDVNYATAPVPEKKRKRIAPTLISSELDPNRNRDIPTGADDVVLNDPDRITPGVIYTGHDGKKRVVPITDRAPETGLTTPAAGMVHSNLNSLNEDLQAGGKRGLKAAENIVQDAAQRANEANALDLREGYLGKKMFPIDQIFYGNVGVGKEIPTDTDAESFGEISKISSGRRLYLHSAMKRYLRAPRQIFRRHDKFFSARCPYPSHLVPSHHAPSFTLFYAMPSPNTTVHATREDRSKWPEVDESATSQKGLKSTTNTDDERSAHFNIPSQVLLGGPSSYDNWDPDFLEKYRHIEGGDEVLPVFGDSDDEGEYDLDTWREIEDEFGSQEKPLIGIKKKGLLEEEINAAIDEGIAEIVVKWHKEKLPKREQRAWRKWKSTRNKREFIRKAQIRINHINKDRLMKMRREILSEIWTSQKAVRKQSRIMEQSIFEREDLVYDISILESRVPPEKPLPQDNPVLKPKTKDGHRRTDVETDVESLGSTEDPISSDDDLGDFIVDDDFDTFNDEEQELMDLDAEGGDEDAPVSDPDSHSEEDEPIDEGPSEQQTTVKAEKPTLADVEMPDASPTSDSQTKTSDGQDIPIIDLTQLTSDSSSAERSFKKPPAISLITPIKKEAAGDDLSLLAPGQPSGFKLKLKRRTNIISNPEVINLSDSDEKESDRQPNVLPNFDELEAIAKYSPKGWQKTNDRVRLVISAICRLSRDMQSRLQTLFSEHREPDLWDEMIEAAWELCDEIQFGGAKDPAKLKALIVLIRLFEMYAFCQYRPLRASITQEEIQNLKRQRDKFTPFFARCSVTIDRCLAAMVDGGETDRDDQEDKVREDDDDDEPQSATRRRNKSVTISTTDDEVPEHHSSQKLRKKKVFENAQARDLRIQDQRRLQEQEERRKVLRLRLAQSQLNVDRDKIIINDSKFDDEGFVYVHDQIAKRIKDHQIDGVRFMWNQILLSNGDQMQGCLLAHTMGLGKTMQVITLLVAIAEAAESLDPTINKQIPPSLRVSKTLVLCPPGLINNWMDELLLWTPDDVDLGQFYKIDATIKDVYRLDIIETWVNEGGILVMGYEMFRNIIANKGTAKRPPPLTEVDHAKVREQLLDGPNIIIADEAHKMKNANAKLTQATIGFRSKSRIALTGSPLANNVEEYHTMIEWVAPNYLGPIREFKDKYVIPITEGLYLESTNYEKRKSLKMLGVLKEDLAPKVHRADMSVLRDDLPHKMEFVITVPLTKVQTDAYSLYVRAMQGKDVQLTKGGDIRLSTMWHWLTLLSILCNHPSCFRSKLAERINDAKKANTIPRQKSRGSLAGDGIMDLDDAVWKSDVSETMVREELELFEKCEYLDAIDNSNKVRILIQILDAARDAKDKVLVFSQSLATLNYLEGLCQRTGRKFNRLDGSTPIPHRQAMIKSFNTGDAELYLISTAAGGLGLNIYGANRVVIFDFKFNPIMEEQAVGRAYRIGQTKQVFVYRFVAGGTFEELIHNKTIFKTQLASRVVDKRNPMALAKKTAGEYLFEPREVAQQDLSSFRGMDPMVLDKILDSQTERSNVRGIVITDTFARDDDLVLTAEEQKEVKQLLSDERLKRSDPTKWLQVEAERRRKLYEAQVKAAAHTATSIAGLSAPKHFPFNPIATQKPQPAAVNAQEGQSAAIKVPGNQPAANIAREDQPSTSHAYENRPAPNVVQENRDKSVPAPLHFSAGSDSRVQSRDSIAVGDANSKARELPEAPILAALAAAEAKYQDAVYTTPYTGTNLGTREVSTLPIQASQAPAESQKSSAIDAPIKDGQRTGQDLSTETGKVLPLMSTASQTISNSTRPETPSNENRMPRSLFNGISPPSAKNSAESTQKRHLLAIQQSLKKGHRLGDHVFADDHSRDKTIEDLSDAIFKAVSRRAEDDTHTITLLSLQVSGSLSQDPQLCARLFSGELKPEDFVKTSLSKDKHPVSPLRREGTDKSGSAKVEGENPAINSTAPKPNNSTDTTKPFMSPSLANTTLRRSSRNQQSYTQSPHAEDDIEYLKTIGVSKRPQISDGNQETRSNNATTGRPQRNLPQWVIDRLSKSSKRNSYSR